MHHHQRIHHHSRSLSHHDSPPRHSPPHDPRYEYHQPFTSSRAAHSPCPHCSAPSTSFHMDPSSGDLICTQCGAVLDDHMRDETAEWKDYNNAEDLMRGTAGKRSRCGESVDESKWVGGLMPTKVSSTVYMGTAGFGGTGSGAGAGTADEKFRLAQIRQRLKRTHNMIENMVEQEQKARYAEVVLECKARDAKLSRGENNEDDMSNGGIVVDGDYEGLMATRQDAEKPQQKKARATMKVKLERVTAKKSTSTDHEKAFISLKDRKWSLTDAILLHGTLDQVQQWVTSTPTNGEEWTHSSLESEQVIHLKKFDASTRSSLQKLYLAFAILEKAAHKLDLAGAAGSSNQTFREAVSWLLKFVTENDGLRIKGISSGSSTLSGLDLKNCTLALSIFGSEHRGFAAASSTKSRPASLATELHRLRQYASLGSAILYLSAKRTGVGRTLTEVCSAFGMYKVLSPINTTVGGEGESLVRPKYCSRAMQELRMVLPEVVSPSSNAPIKEEGEQAPVKVTPTYSSNSMEISPMPVKSEYIPDQENVKSNGNYGNLEHASTMPNPEEAALADLVSRMGNSLTLPQCAISAAIAVAIQCTRDARASTTMKAAPSKRSSGSAHAAHIRPRKRKIKSPSQSKDAPDVIAVSSILLVCMAGGTMQRLARQAMSKSAPLRQAQNKCDDAAMEGTLEGSAGATQTSSAMSNPLDDLHDEFYSSSPKPDSISSINSSKVTKCNTSCTAQSNNSKPETLSSWAAWNNRPSWHRDVSAMEQCTGVPRKTLISYYSNVMHPRRSHFLGVAIKKEDQSAMGMRSGLLHNIVAAVPLMSLRNL